VVLVYQSFQVKHCVVLLMSLMLETASSETTRSRCFLGNVMATPTADGWTDVVVVAVAAGQALALAVETQRKVTQVIVRLPASSLSRRYSARIVRRPARQHVFGASRLQVGRCLQAARVQPRPSTLSVARVRFE
jgi:hypothetical protein